jgi:hypothetical protein
MASDVITTGCITWCLLRSKTSFDSTNRIINKLLVWVHSHQHYRLARAHRQSQFPVDGALTLLPAV